MLLRQFNPCPQKTYPCSGDDILAAQPSNLIGAKSTIKTIAEVPIPDIQVHAAADSGILLNQKRLRVDLVHEDEREPDEKFRILWHRQPLRAGFAERRLAKRFH
jgi:hypothetical protein